MSGTRTPTAPTEGRDRAGNFRCGRSPEAIKIGNRIPLLSPYPGRVKAEVVDVDTASAADGSAGRLEKEIHELLFAEAHAAPARGLRGTHMASTARIVPRPSTGPAKAEVEARLGVFELAWQHGAVRKTAIILALALVWELYGRWLDNPLPFPTLTESLWANVLTGVLPARAWASIKVLLMGYAVGVVLAFLLTVAAINTRIGSDFLVDDDGDALAAAGDRAPAAGTDLVRARQRLAGVHPDPIGLVAGGAQHACGLPGGVADAADGGAQLRPAGLALHRQDPGAGGLPLDPGRLEDRLGVRVTDAGRGGAGVRGGVGAGGLGWFIFENRNLLEIPSVFAAALFAGSGLSIRVMPGS